MTKTIKRTGINLVFAMLVLVVAGVALARASQIKIGVLVKRGPERCLEKWTPTAQYLTHRIAGKTFVIAPLGFEEVCSSIEKGEVDFILANPSFYVELEKYYKANRIATLKNKGSEGAYIQFGGGVFCRADNKDIINLADLKNIKFAIPDKRSFGGWIAVWRELRENGIDPQDFKDLKYCKTHDNVVYSVRDGLADAGSVRTDTLERMDREGKIDIKAFRVINDFYEQSPEFSFHRSTRLYPEWPFAKAGHTSDELAKKVGVALMEMPPDSAAAKAARCAGWAIPSNYQTVHECLKELKLGPYKDLGKITLFEVIQTYWYLILLSMALFFVLVLGLIVFIKLNRKLGASHAGLESEIKERKLAEEKIEHLNIVLRAIRDVNQLIVQETDQDRLLKKACDILTKTRGYYNAWIAIMDESEHLIKMVSSESDKNFALLEKRLKQGGLTRCAQKALSRPGVVATKDPSTQCADCPVAPACADRAAYTVRLEHLEKIYGLMSVSIPASFADDKEEKGLFNEVAGDISMALYKFQIVNEKSRAEISLGESEERHKKILESSSAGYWFLGPDKKTVEVNQALCDMLGYSQKEIIGRSPLDFADDENQEIFKHQMALITDTAHRSYEIVLKTKTNKDVFTHFSASTLFDKFGKAKGAFALVTDITGRKQLEEQLQQAQKMEAIGTLAGGIAHDFNNILSPIVGYTEMVHMDLPDGSLAKANLEEVLAASERAKDLVAQILTFSRKTQEEKKPLNIAYIVNEVLKFMRSSLPSTIEIKPHVKKDCGTVMADYTQIHQVVMNLCTNAFHAMRKDGGILKVTLTPVELGPENMPPGLGLEPGPHAKLSISDTGCGIKSEVKDRIFEPYFTTKEVGEGTGMGLAVAHAIVIKHHGAISVKSEPGKGTVFDVYLPVVEKMSVRQNGSAKMPVLTGDERILLVDDETPILEMIAQMLENLGYSVWPMTSSEKALKAFMASPDEFDIVITDMTMPHITGDVLAGKILEIRPNIPIILCTGFSEKITPKKATEIGIAAFVKKPVVMKELAKTIREVLDKE